MHAACPYQSSISSTCQLGIASCWRLRKWTWHTRLHSAAPHLLDFLSGTSMQIQYSTISELSATMNLQHFQWWLWKEGHSPSPSAEGVGLCILFPEFLGNRGAFHTQMDRYGQLTSVDHSTVPWKWLLPKGVHPPMQYHNRPILFNYTWALCSIKLLFWSILFWRQHILQPQLRLLKFAEICSKSHCVGRPEVDGPWPRKC